MYLLFKNVLFSKKIILLQSYLQILNFRELTYSKRTYNENLICKITAIFRYISRDLVSYLEICFHQLNQVTYVI